MDAADRSALPPPAATSPPRRIVCCCCYNKADLVYGSALPAPSEDALPSPLSRVLVLNVVARLAAIVTARAGEQEAPALTQARHRQQLLRCRAALSSFLADPSEDIELRAEDLRRAAQALGRLVGAIAVEEVLDQVFARFCIGK